MAKYRFVGEARTVFPSIVIEDGDGHRTLEVDPGDVVDLPRDPRHPELVKVGAATKAPAKKATASKRAPKPPTSAPADKTEE